VRPAWLTPIIAVAVILLVAAMLWPAALDSAAPAARQLAVESNPWIVWEALNIFGEIFVSRQSILTADDCACNYSCGGLCPPCVAVRKAQVMGPFCSSAEAWATICSRMTDRGRFAIGSPCPWWAVIDGVRHTIDWNPWTACPQIGGDVVIPHPTCELPQPTATVTATPTPTPQADWDIAITADKVEWTQAIQCLDAGDGDAACADNSIPLVQDKLIVIRVWPTITVKEGREPEDADCVSGMLTVAGHEDDPLLPMDPCLSLNIDKHESIDRNDPTHSLNFLLPITLTRQSSLQLTLEVDSPDQAITDTNEANNTLVLPLMFRDMPTFSVLYVRVNCCGVTPNRGPDYRTSRMAVKTLTDYYPLGEGDYTYRWMVRGLNLLAIPQGFDDRWLVRQLNRIYQKEHDANPATAPDQVFGWLPEDLQGFSYLAASDPAWAQPPGLGKVAYARTQLIWHGTTFFPTRLLAHEMAHNLGLYHVPTDDACGAEAYTIGSQKQDWPYSNADIQETGYWPAMELRGEGQSSGWTVPFLDEDIMTYCGDNPAFPAWLSPHNYKKLMAALESPSSAPALDVAQDYLVVSGYVTPSGGGHIEMVETTRSTDPPATSAPGSAFCLELQNGAGAMLSSTCFDSWFKGHLGDAVDKAGFFFVLPAPAGTQRVALKRHGSVIDTRVASAHAPVVTISAPQPGAVWSNGPQTVRWTATDADGDAMTYSILYTHDGGTTWLPVELDLTETSYELDAGEIPGGAQARFRVIANDGFLDGSADSGLFTVPRKTPGVTIDAPVDGARVRVGKTISLIGSGYDLEDGSLPGSALSWSSNLAGALGTGALLQTSSLQHGDHRITLTAHDAGGMTATASITIQVRLYQIDLPIITKNALPLLPTATPAPCDLLFGDDFSVQGLPGWTASGGDWANAGGYMAVRTGALVNARNLRSISAGDVSYEGTVTLRTGSAVGLSLRSAAASSGYDVVIDIYENRLKLIKQPNSTLLGAYGFDVRRDRPYRLRIEARGGRFDVYLDGAHVLAAGDGAYLSGSLGVYAANSTAEFDNLRACRLSVAYEMRVNCGGALFTDTQKMHWYEDKAYSAGGWGYDASSLTGAGDAAVSGTEDDELYRSLRWAYATFGYRFDVPNGGYRVRLLFVEPTFTQAGKRSFDVQIEGQTVLSGLDLYAAAGHDSAYSRTFTATVTDGQLHISFVKKVENPLVSGIEVIGLAGAAPTATRPAVTPATPSRTPTRTSTAAATASRTPTRTPTAGSVVVTLYYGDARTFSQPPAVRAWANANYVAPPSGITIADSGGLWRSNEWVGLLNGGQWIQAANANASTAAGIEFWGGAGEGWARVLVDGVERWRGSVYGDGSAAYPAQKYLEVSGLPAAPHTIRVENLGIDGIGGWHSVTLYFFGFGPVSR